MPLTAKEPTDSEGRPYHIRLSRNDVGKIALLPGDPGRVEQIAKRLKRAKQLSSNREFTSWGGEAGGQRVVVVSTGIGGPSTAIVVEELARLGVEVMVRVGTCGALSRKVGVGSLIIADSAVRMEGTSQQYAHPGYPAAATPQVVLALAKSAHELGKKFSIGVVASTDSFYPGQGRKGFGGYFPSDKVNLLDDMRSAKVLCFEMEAATLFTVGRVLGAKTGAVLAVVGNRETDEFRTGAGVDGAIDTAVLALSKLADFGF